MRHKYEEIKEEQTTLEGITEKYCREKHLGFPKTNWGNNDDKEIRNN